MFSALKRRQPPGATCVPATAPRHVLLGTGEVYLDCVLHDLRRRGTCHSGLVPPQIRRRRLRWAQLQSFGFVRVVWEPERDRLEGKCTWRM